MNKRLLSLFLAVMMLFSLLPVSAFAEGNPCGENVTWTLDEEGTLTISGTGWMDEYYYYPNETAPWAKNAASITSLVIEEGVSNIGCYAFINCENLESVSIPATVTYIGYSAFAGCSSIDTVFFGGSKVQWKRVDISSENEPLTSVIPSFGAESHIPTSGTCGEGLSWSITGSILSIFGSGTMEDYDNYSLFSPWLDSSDSIKTVVLSGDIKNIGNYAFKDFEKLESITIPDSVSKIGNSVFDGCSSLESITIPDSVTQIGYNAFYGCSSLESIDIPEGVTNIYDSTFKGCSSLVSVTIPDSVTEIGNSAFAECSSLESITLPNGLTTIPERLCCNCTNLKAVTVPDTITSVGEYAFDGTALYSNPDNWVDDALYIGNVLLKARSDVSDCTVRQGTVCIASSAFYDCSYLKSIDIPNSVKAIGNNAFDRCYLLKSVVIPDSVESIGECAFNYCFDLESVTLGSGISSLNYGTFSECSSLKSIVIPYGVTSIGRDAFCSCDNLESVTLPKSLKSIGSSAFKTCPGLESISIPESVTTISDSAFEGCVNLSNVKLSSGLKTIESSAFASCSNLVAIDIPDSVERVGSCAFECCEALSDISISDSVPSIGYDAFYLTAFYNNADNWKNGVLYCGKHLLRSVSESKSISIKSGTVCIADNAFEDSPSLQSITIPDGVKYIGEYAFLGCSNLSSISLPDSLLSIGTEAFSFTSYYNNDSNWKDNALYIGKYLIKVNPVASEFTVKQGTLGIADYAFVHGGGMFASNEVLKKVTIPEGVKFIGKGAFFSCFTLKSVVIPDSVVTIGEEAFRNCTSMESAVIGKGLTSLPEKLFYFCFSLSDITIPKSVTSIGESAFSTSSDTTNISYGGTEAQWNAINIADGNDALDNAKISFGGVSLNAPTLKITTSAGKPQISWNAVDGATKYYIYRSTDGGKTYKYVTYTSSTSYTDSKATVGTKYYYKVVAAATIDGTTVKSDYSNIKSTTCTTAAPTISIARSNGKPKLSWKAVTGATKYYIYRSTDGKTYSYLTSTTSTSYTNTGAASGKKYYYKVKAVKVVNGTAVASAYSNEKSLFTTLTAPTVSITRSSGKPKISWKAVTGADKYIIYRSTDGKTFSQLTTTTKLSYTNTKATKNKTYYYKVKAVTNQTSAATSAYSKAVSIKATK